MNLFLLLILSLVLVAKGVYVELDPALDEKARFPPSAKCVVQIGYNNYYGNNATGSYSDTMGIDDYFGITVEGTQQALNMKLIKLYKNIGVGSMVNNYKTKLDEHLRKDAEGSFDNFPYIKNALVNHTKNEAFARGHFGIKLKYFILSDAEIKDPSKLSLGPLGVKVKDTSNIDKDYVLITNELGQNFDMDQDEKNLNSIRNVIKGNFPDSLYQNFPIIKDVRIKISSDPTLKNFFNIDSNQIVFRLRIPITYTDSRSLDPTYFKKNVTIHYWDRSTAKYQNWTDTGKNILTTVIEFNSENSIPESRIKASLSLESKQIFLDFYEKKQDQYLGAIYKIQNWFEVVYFSEYIRHKLHGLGRYNQIFSNEEKSGISYVMDLIFSNIKANAEEVIRWYNYENTIDIEDFYYENYEIGYSCRHWKVNNPTKARPNPNADEIISDILISNRAKLTEIDKRKSVSKEDIFVYDICLTDVIDSYIKFINTRKLRIGLDSFAIPYDMIIFGDAYPDNLMERFAFTFLNGNCNNLNGVLFGYSGIKLKAPSTSKAGLYQFIRPPCEATDRACTDVETKTYLHELELELYTKRLAYFEGYPTTITKSDLAEVNGQLGYSSFLFSWNSRFQIWNHYDKKLNYAYWSQIGSIDKWIEYNDDLDEVVNRTLTRRGIDCGEFSKGIIKCKFLEEFWKRDYNDFVKRFRFQNRINTTKEWDFYYCLHTIPELNLASSRFGFLPEDQFISKACTLKNFGNKPNTTNSTSVIRQRRDLSEDSENNKFEHLEGHSLDSIRCIITHHKDVNSIGNICKRSLDDSEIDSETEEKKRVKRSDDEKKKTNRFGNIFRRKPKPNQLQFKGTGGSGDQYVRERRLEAEGFIKSRSRIRVDNVEEAKESLRKMSVKLNNRLAPPVLNRNEKPKSPLVNRALKPKPGQSDVSLAATKIQTQVEDTIYSAIVTKGKPPTEKPVKEVKGFKAFFGLGRNRPLATDVVKRTKQLATESREAIYASSLEFKAKVETGDAATRIRNAEWAKKEGYLFTPQNQQRIKQQLERTKSFSTDDIYAQVQKNRPRLDSISSIDSDFEDIGAAVKDYNRKKYGIKEGVVVNPDTFRGRSGSINDDFEDVNAALNAYKKSKSKSTPDLLDDNSDYSYTRDLLSRNNQKGKQHYSDQQLQNNLGLGAGFSRKNPLNEPLFMSREELQFDLDKIKQKQNPISISGGGGRGRFGSDSSDDFEYVPPLNSRKPLGKTYSSDSDDFEYFPPRSNNKGAVGGQPPIPDPNNKPKLPPPVPDAKNKPKLQIPDRPDNLPAVPGKKSPPIPEKPNAKVEEVFSRPGPDGESIYTKIEKKRGNYGEPGGRCKRALNGISCQWNPAPPNMVGRSEFNNIQRAAPPRNPGDYLENQNPLYGVGSNTNPLYGSGSGFQGARPESRIYEEIDDLISSRRSSLASSNQQLLGRPNNDIYSQAGGIQNPVPLPDKKPGLLQRAKNYINNKVEKFRAKKNSGMKIPGGFSDGTFPGNYLGTDPLDPTLGEMREQTKTAQKTAIASSMMIASSMLTSAHQQQVSRLISGELLRLPKEEALAITAIDTLASIGGTIAAMGAANPKVAAVGLAMQAIAGLATTIMQFYKVLTNAPPVEDPVIGKLNKYYDATNSEEMGVRRCLLPSSDLTITLRAKNFADLATRSEEAKKRNIAIDDNMFSEVIAMYHTDIVFNAKLTIKCPNGGQLRLKEANIFSYIQELDPKDDFRYFSVTGISTLITEYPVLHFSCGSVWDLKITSKKYKTSDLNLIKKAGPGEPTWSGTLSTKVCDKYPFKKFYVRTPGCELDSGDSSVTYTSCSILFRKTNWEEKKRRWVTYDPYAAEGVNRRIYAFGRTDFTESFPLKPNENDDDYTLCLGYNKNFCKWPEPFTLTDSSQCSQKTRFFKLEIGSLEFTGNNVMYGFAVTCPVQAIPTFVGEFGSKITDLKIQNINPEGSAKLLVPKRYGLTYWVWCQHRYIPKLKSDFVKMVSVIPTKQVDQSVDVDARIKEMVDFGMNAMHFTSYQGPTNDLNYENYKGGYSKFDSYYGIDKDAKNYITLLDYATDVNTENVDRIEKYYPSFEPIKISAAFLKHSFPESNVVYEMMRDGKRTFSSLWGMVSSCKVDNGIFDYKVLGTFTWSWHNERKAHGRIDQRDHYILKPTKDIRLLSSKKDAYGFVDRVYDSSNIFYSNYEGPRVYATVKNPLTGCTITYNHHKNDFVFDCASYSLKKDWFENGYDKLCLSVGTSNDVCKEPNHYVHDYFNGDEDKLKESDFDRFNGEYFDPKNNKITYGSTSLIYAGSWCYYAALYTHNLVAPLQNIGFSSSTSVFRFNFNSMDINKLEGITLGEEENEMVPWEKIKLISGLEKELENLMDLSKHPYYQSINELPLYIKEESQSMVRINVDPKDLQEIKKEKEKEEEKIKDKIFNITIELLGQEINENDWLLEKQEKRSIECCYLKADKDNNDTWYLEVETLTPQVPCESNTSFYLHKEVESGMVLGPNSYFIPIEQAFNDYEFGWKVCLEPNVLIFNSEKEFEEWDEALKENIMQEVLEEYGEELADNATIAINMLLENETLAEIDELIENVTYEKLQLNLEIQDYVDQVRDKDRRRRVITYFILSVIAILMFISFLIFNNLIKSKFLIFFVRVKYFILKGLFSLVYICNVSWAIYLLNKCDTFKLKEIEFIQEHFVDQKSGLVARIKNVFNKKSKKNMVVESPPSKQNIYSLVSISEDNNSKEIELEEISVPLTE